MDFEQQLEKAERLESPSLVGSSLRSADDSPHNNYIHPEKYKSRPKNKNAHSLLNSQIGASLDDLISEGALLGSEEDFEKFLDDGGHVKEDARYLDDGESAEAEKTEKENPEKVEKEKSSPLKNEVKVPQLDGEKLDDSDSHGSDSKAEAVKPADAAANDGLYSTPNLSEYQLEHLIKDHNEMLSYVKSHNLDKLPGYRAEPKNAQFLRDSRVPLALPTTATFGDAVAIHTGPSEGLHTPYFQHDGRSRSRSQNRSRIAERSSSRSSVKPHLARGDSYKNIHEDEPSKYELPSDWQPTEEESTDGDRRSRQSKPTLGDSIAAAEAAREQQRYHEDARASSAASLLTTGDYTNFNVDIPEPTYFNGRSASSTNYLRSISRSRSRQPESKRHSQLTEKNDADPEELISEGALVTDDPYSSINHLDTMMEEVLGKSDKEKPSKSEEKKEKREEAGDKEVEGKEKGEDKEVEGKEKKVETAEKEETTTKEETATKEEKDDTKSTEVETVKVEPGKVESVGNVASDEAVPTEDQLKKASDVISEHANQDDVKVEVPDQKEQQPGEEIKKKGESQEAEPEKKTLITDYSEPINQDSVPEDKEPVAAKNDDVVGETMVTNKEKAEPETKPASKDEDEDFDVSPEELRKHLESQPVYIFTSYAGGMQIMHRTNRLATILKGNGIEFTQRDLGTDEEAKKIWRRYSGGKSLPGVVRGDDFIGNWEDIDEANEEYQVRVLVYETM